MFVVHLISVVLLVCISLHLVRGGSKATDREMARRRYAQNSFCLNFDYINNGSSFMSVGVRLADRAFFTTCLDLLSVEPSLSP